MAHFVFRRHDSVGNAAAEEDANFLEDCFIDKGDLRLLRDCEESKRIIVGRVGSGKTALLSQLKNTGAHVIQLSPHDLSLNFIATNKVISFFEEAGVNLSPFYGLLWKHLIVVELLKEKFHIRDDNSHRDFMRTIKSMIEKKDRNKELALDYLEQWGNKFWLTTEQRIQELTTKVEKSLSGGFDGKFSDISFTTQGAKNLSDEQRVEIKEHGLDVVSKVQIRELDNMLTVLEDNIFNDKKNPYYLTIDMLDEDWADDRIKFKLIRALIDVVKRFKSLSNVKIILAIRVDLLNKALYFETTAGFQEEKFKSMFLNLQWSENELKNLVEKRINKLIKIVTRKKILHSKMFFLNMSMGRILSSI